ncbi:MAG TPA: hypothetical protein VLM37_05065 [Fibrobacteraceae bacterium]|nr:hypothetical protein [Fibrobacteraceae bacterium]
MIPYARIAFVFMAATLYGAEPWGIYGSIDIDSIKVLDSSETIYVPYTYDGYSCVAWRLHGSTESDTILVGACEYGSEGEMCLDHVQTLSEFKTEVAFLDSVGALNWTSGQYAIFNEASDTVTMSSYYYIDNGAYTPVLDGDPLGCSQTSLANSIPAFSSVLVSSPNSSLQFHHSGSALSWSSGALHGPYRVSVLDAAGREVYRSGVLAASQGQLNVSLPAGHGAKLVRLESLASGQVTWSGWLAQQNE